MIVIIVATSIILFLAFAMVSFFNPSSTITYSGLSAAANQTVYNTLSSSYNALNLISILTLVGVAALIIGLIVGGFMLFRSSGAAE